MKEMDQLHYFLSRGDFHAEFSFGSWKLMFQLRFLMTSSVAWMYQVNCT